MLQKSFSANGRIVFEGDNYSDEWHAEAEQRGLLNLRTTPDALPQLLEKPTIDVFGNYEVLSEREIESRFEVLAEQYAVKLNIEAETLADMARTMVLPAGAAPARRWPSRPACRRSPRRPAARSTSSSQRIHDAREA